MNVDKALQIKTKILNEFQSGYYEMNPDSTEYRQIITEEENGLYYRFGSDNPILFTIQVYTLFKMLGIFFKEDRLRLNMAIADLHRRIGGGVGHEGCVLGLYNRNPGKDNRKDQWDNYEAIACSAMFGEGMKVYAEDIDDYGKRFLWYSYDNRSPFKFSIHGFFKPFPNFRYFECIRQGWHVFTYRACANRWVGLFNYLWFIGKYFTENNNPYETTGKLISWIRYKAIGHKWYVKPFARRFEKKMEKMYGKDWVVALIKAYHGTDSTIYELAKCLEVRE